jgi:hypothetical protein
MTLYVRIDVVFVSRQYKSAKRVFLEPPGRSTESH